MDCLRNFNCNVLSKIAVFIVTHFTLPCYCWYHRFLCGQVFCYMIAVPMPIIRQKIEPDSIVYTDYWRGYNALDVSEFKYYRINHSELFANKHNHINGIENFWNQAKRHMRKFNDIPKQHFNLFLKECEWRFNRARQKSY
jgi:transposase-like protein